MCILLPLDTDGASHKPEQQEDPDDYRYCDVDAGAHLEDWLLGALHAQKPTSNPTTFSSTSNASPHQPQQFKHGEEASLLLKAGNLAKDCRFNDTF